MEMKKFREKKGVFMEEGMKIVIEEMEKEWRIKKMVLEK